MVGGVTPACTAVAVQLYQQRLENVVPVSSTQVAEMVKLLENTFRSVNIGLVNELALMCSRLGIDVWAIHTVQFSNHTGYGRWRGPVFTGDMVREVMPFLAVMIGALALITLFPDLVLYLPRQFGYKG